MHPFVIPSLGGWVRKEKEIIFAPFEKIRRRNKNKNNILMNTASLNEFIPKNSFIFLMSIFSFRPHNPFGY